jgi:hypothetical protein
VKDTPAVTVSHTLSNLFENVLGFILS